MTPHTASPSVSSPRPSTEQRLATWRAEVAASADAARRAVLLYEIGHALEVEQGQESAAIREYLAAYNADPTFRPPLSAMVRIFERRRSFTNLARLYEAEFKGAGNAAERAHALLDRGALLEERAQDPAGARGFYEKALAEDPEGAALSALYLERLRGRGGAEGAGAALLAARAERVRDAALRAALWLDVARAREDEGDVDGAFAATHLALDPRAADASGPDDLRSVRAAAFAHLERLARRHGRSEERLAALEGLASSASSSPEGGEETAEGRSPGAPAAVVAARALAQWKLHHLDDVEGATAVLSRAIDASPGEDAPTLERMLARLRGGDAAGVAEDARRWLSADVEGRHAAWLHLCVAEAARSSGDADAELSSLEAALAASPSSAVAWARLEAFVEGHPEVASREARLAARAEAERGEARTALWLEAAFEAASRGLETPAIEQDAGEARSSLAARVSAHFAHALEDATDRAGVARAWNAAVAAIDPSAVGRRDAFRALVAGTVDPEERSVALRDWLRFEQDILRDTEASAAVLGLASKDERAAAWVAEASWLEAASRQDAPAAARAHQALADLCDQPDERAAHLAASGRCFAVAGDADSAIAVLRQALVHAPAHRYAVPLIAALLREKGELDAVAGILAAAAEADRGGRAAQRRRYAAGAASEVEGDAAAARAAYEEAAGADPTAEGPLSALARLADRTSDAALRHDVRARRAAIEQASGHVGWASLEHGEHLHRTGKQDGARPEEAASFLRSALEVQELGPSAALGLALLGSARLRDGTAPGVDGLRTLVASAEGAAKPGWLRELGGTLLDAAGDLDAAARVASDVLAASPDDVWGRWTTLRAAWAAPANGTARADAMLALADHTDDAAVSAELLALALHGFAMARTPHEDGLLRAGDLEAALPGSAVAARVAREVLTPDDDESERADALERSLVHTPDALSGSLRAAAGRAFSAAGRADDACEALARTVADDPDDLASWEALRVAARDAGRFRHVVEACDRLASAVSGALRATLLEEAAAVLMDELAADVEAEPRLRAALAIDAARPIAFGRLRDLVAERGDEPALLDLVQARADRTDDPDALCPLLYEIARLHRSMGQRAEALASLENLMMLEPEHVGGLALQVDLHVQGEAWADAVDALRALAVAKDVPGSQRRIARLGAADFLEKKLSDLPGALEELAAIDALGLGDRALHERMATLFERVGQFDGALEALRKAAASARDGAERAAIERRAARMSQEHRGDVAGATAALRRALVAWPADLDAATSLAAHLEPGPVLDLSRSVEGAVRAMIEADPTDPEALRALARAATLRQDAALQASALSTLGALGLATEEERGWLAERAASRRPASARPLGDAGVALLLAPGLDAAMLELALLATETVLEMDHPEPAAFGFGRQDQQTGRPLPGVAQAVLDLATFFGAPAGEVWIGGREPRLVTALGLYKGKPAWLLGSAVTAPLAAASRLEVGRFALALRLGLGAYASRSPESAATTIFAVAAAAGAPFRGAEGRPGMPDATRAATKSISRRVRKAMPDLVARMGSDGRAVVSFCDALFTSLGRAGCLASGDLESSLRAVLGVAPERSAVRAHEGATSLVKLWNSQGAVAMRQDLGLST